MPIHNAMLKIIHCDSINTGKNRMVPFVIASEAIRIAHAEYTESYNTSMKIVRLLNKWMNRHKVTRISFDEENLTRDEINKFIKEQDGICRI